MGEIRTKRVYDPPSMEDGKRFLVDRLWPRGMRKETLRIEGWNRESAPSTELRNWFNHQPEKWEEFKKLYFTELDRNIRAWQPLLEAVRKGNITLVFGAKDIEYNNAVALAEYLNKKVISD